MGGVQLKRKWIIITLLLTFIIGGLKSSPVLASIGDWPLTFLEKVSLKRSSENISLTTIVDSLISLSESHFLLPSNLVESHHPEIVQLANELTLGLSTEEEKSRSIFLWVASNISYDTEAYFRDPLNPRYYSSLETLEKRVALCSGYAHLNAALHRAIGIEAKVVYGEEHAWNEVKIAGEWLEQDPTYGSGGLNIEKQLFIPQLNVEYFSSVDLRKEGEFPW
jgi:transglutaminase-like putative cysteine protease